MTTLVDAAEAIYQQFVPSWGATTELVLDNEKFDPPDETEWVRLSIRHTASTQETLGPPGERKFLRTGSAFVQVFTPVGTGTKLTRQLAEQARNTFEGLQLTGTDIRFLDVIVREIGPDGTWYQTTVEAVFEYNEKK
jgi:hypothetical protein